MRTFTREEVQRLTRDDLIALRRDFPDARWADDAAAIYTELHELAQAAEPEDLRLSDLYGRTSELIREHDLKGLQPLLWMIQSLRAVDVA